MSSGCAISRSALAGLLSLSAFSADACVLKVAAHPSLANCHISGSLVGNNWRVGGN